MLHSTPDQILLELKTRGPATTRELSILVGITRQAAREHLTRLGDEQLVEFTKTATGVGRPGHTWSLTGKGHGRFPDTHAQMTVELIDAIRDEFGEAGVARMVARREEAAWRKYQQAMNGAETLDERVARLVRLRSAEGYMADASRRDDGSYVIAENHCPICAAAAACQGFCRSELTLFCKLLAPAKVERSEHLLAGGRRCCYLVLPTGNVSLTAL